MSWALITGGSKGLGYSIAEALGGRGYDILLLARNKEDLVSAKHRLESNWSIQVETFSIDLSLPGSAEEIGSWCRTQAFEIKILCNVAGLGGAKDFLSLPLSDLIRMVSVNFESPMSLTLSLIPILQKNAPSFILNVGSLAGFAPIPAKNIYSATKSALLFFSYSLRCQLKEKNISVSCLCPGPIFTKPAVEKETRKKLGWLGSQMAVEPARVGEMAVRNTLKRKMLIIPGRLSTLISFVLRVMPARLLARIFSESIRGDEKKRESQRKQTDQT
ncbi:MAG: SDR family NAD(P)-dependent oxidoreductase [Bacteroidota bacterium]|nr:SDR family NAD(P)-dependent oxidoreductase [Bacteroidota bacterium]MDP4211207.1 SDR family NAD(P)-dependent oxidoreductase [Bacteroidota bacterium]MDP4248714.1 SDR family NAD(P)-dependent oxidoreductase [Bacteroidota bacterium]